MPILSNFPAAIGSTQKFALGPVTSLSYMAAGGRVYIKWNDPNDLQAENGVTLAYWQRSLLMRKANGIPDGIDDPAAVLVAEISGTRMSESSDYICDTGLTDGTVYYYKIFSVTSQNVVNDCAENEFTTTPNPVILTTLRITNIVTAPTSLNVIWQGGESVFQNGVALVELDYYVIKIKKHSVSTYTSVIRTPSQVPPDSTGARSFVLNSLERATEYDVLVQAFATAASNGSSVSSYVQTLSTDSEVISSLPSVSGTYTYSGSVIEPTFVNYDSSKMTRSGSVNGTEARTYTTYFTPLTGYQWPSGTPTSSGTLTGMYSVTWTINKAAAPSVSNIPSSITLNPSTTQYSFTINTLFDGTISATSSDTSIATVSVTGSQITVSSVNSTTGTATITINFTNGINYNNPASRTVSVNAQFLPAPGQPLNTYTWQQLSMIGKAGVVLNYMAPSYGNSSSTGVWNTGDYIPVTIGTRTYNMMLIGVEHDTPSNTATYGQSKAGLTFQLGRSYVNGEYAVYSTQYAMNTTTYTSTNPYNYEGCSLRQTLNTTLYEELKGIIGDYIVEVTKYNYTKYNVTNTVQSTNDKLFLPTLCEVTPNARYAMDGTTYKYYELNNVAYARMKYNGSKALVAWALRTPDLVSGSGTAHSRTVQISTSGGTSSTSPIVTTSQYISYCFCI